MEKEPKQPALTLFEQKHKTKQFDPIVYPEKLYSRICRMRMELEWLNKSPEYPDEIAPDMDQRLSIRYRLLVNANWPGLSARRST